MRCSLQQMLIDGLFHSEPHPGNVMVLRVGWVGLIDSVPPDGWTPWNSGRCGR
jgi:hypothetical protein